MLLGFQVSLRSFHEDGNAITEADYSQIGARGSFTVVGLGEEEHAVIISGVALSLDDFKGRGASERFYKAIDTEVERFASFLSALDPNAFRSLQDRRITSDLLLSFEADESTMDCELPEMLTSSAVRLGLPISLLVNPATDRA
jgi:hypothetical protein